MAHRGLSEGSSHLPRRLYQVLASLWISVIWFSQSPWGRRNIVPLSRCEADLGGVWQDTHLLQEGLSAFADWCLGLTSEGGTLQQMFPSFVRDHGT